MKVDIFTLSPSGFQRFLHDRIPPARFLGIEVTRFDDEEIRMRIPISLNHNDKMTAFAGSINSLLTLCGWSRVLRTVRSVDPESELVIGKSAVTFRKPLVEDLEAVCGPLPPGTVEPFLARYLKEGKAKLELLLSLSGGDSRPGTGMSGGDVLFSGVYCAYRNRMESGE